MKRLILIPFYIALLSNAFGQSKPFEDGMRAYYNYEYAKGRQLLQQATTEFNAKGETSQALKAMAHTALCDIYNGDYGDAIQLLNQGFTDASGQFGDVSLEVSDFYSGFGKYYEILEVYDTALMFSTAAMAIKQGHLAPTHIDLADVWINIGIAYDYSGVYDSAIVYYKKALENVRGNFGSGHPYTAYLNNDLGVVYSLMGNHGESLRYAKAALNSRREVYGQNSSEAGESLHNMAVASEGLGNLEDALNYYRQALTLKEKVFGAQSVEVAAAQASLGNALSRNNNFKEAMDFNQKSYDLRLKLLGKSHEKTLDNLKNLGNICFDASRYAKASEYYQEYLKAARNVDGVSAGDRAGAMVSYGECLENLGDYSGAAKSFRDATALLDDQHPTSIKARIGLARIYDQQSAYADAVDILKGCLKVLPPDDGTTGFVWNNLGLVYINTSSYDDARKALNESLRIRKQVFGEGSREVSQTLSGFGKLAMSEGNYPLALEYYQKVYDLNGTLYPDNHPQVSLALLNLSAAFGASGDYTREIEFLDQLFSIYKNSFGNSDQKMSSAYLNKALALDKQGSLQEALEHAQKGVQLRIDIFTENAEQAADAFVIMAGLLHRSGRSREGLDYYNRALTVYNRVFSEDHLSKADLLNNMGVVFLDTQQYKKAEEYLQLALIQYQEIFGSQSPQVLAVLNNLALVEYGRDNYPEAIERFKKTIQLGEELGQHGTLDHSTTYQNLGLCYAINEQPELALQAYRRALNLKRDILGEQHYTVADLMLNVGNYHKNKASLDSGLYYYTTALQLYKKAFGSKSERVARCHNNIAEIHMKRGDLGSALNAIESALKSNQDDRGETLNYVQKFVSLVSLVDISYMQFQNSGDGQFLEKGLQQAFEADELLTGTERDFSSEQDKLNFSVYKTLLTNVAIKNIAELYQLNGDEKYLNDALFFAERSKSNILLSALRASNVKSFRLADQDLIDEELNLQVSIQKANQQLYDLGHSSTGKNSQQIAGLKRKLFELNRRFEENQNVQRSKYAKHFKLNKDTRIASLDDLRGFLTTLPNSAFVEYATSDSTLQIIVVHPKKSALFSVRVEAPFEKKLEAFRKAVMFRADNVLQLTSNEIYNTVFKPVESFFKDNNLTVDQLIVVPEGGLNYLPFEALFRPVGDEDRYLIQDYSVSYAYSFSLLDFISNREKVATTNSCLAFAPVFSERTENARMTASTQELHGIVARDLVDKSRAFTRNGTFIEPLPGTEKEIRRIDEIVRSTGMTSKYFTFEDAEEGVLKSGILKEFKYIHFATHGFINEANPAYSGILMSQNNDSKEDCVLYASEIYNLEINADLVTLSACETGLGRMAFGEGIVGLSRSFLYAGASNLLVSQWKVNDESTSRLMIDFYSNIVEGASKAAALRKAKLNLLESEQFKNPYYWAPFVLIGR